MAGYVEGFGLTSYRSQRKYSGVSTPVNSHLRNGHSKTSILRASFERKRHVSHVSTGAPTPILRVDNTRIRVSAT